MGKIGDLWVKLGLKAEDLNKGLNDAEQRVEQSGEKMSGAFNAVKKVGVAAYAAIAVAAAKAFKDILDNSQKLGDGFRRATEQMKGAWNTFISSLASFNWENFGKRMRDAIDASGKLYDVRDRQFEVDNATKLSLAATQKRRLELEETARSSSVSDNERRAAIEELRGILKPIMDNAARQASDLLTATVNSFNAKSGTNYTNEQLEKALVAMGSVGELQNIMSKAGTVEVMETTASHGALGGVSVGTGKFKSNLSDEELSKLSAASAELGFDLQKFAEVYNEMNGDKTIAELVDSFTGFYGAANQLDLDMKRLDILGGNLGGKTGGVSVSTASAPAAERLDLASMWDSAVPKIQEAEASLQNIAELQHNIVRPEGMDEYLTFLQNMADASAEAADMISEAIQDGIVESIQYLTDALMGVEDLSGGQLFAAMLSPLADACVQIGKAVMATGMAMDAFKMSFANPWQAIAAGAALVAVGSAARSAISSAIGGVTGYYPQTGTDSGTSSSAPYSGELTINVTGALQGGNIVISGQKTINDWNR